MERVPLRLAFVWHMHQPDYRDAEGIMRMPWVFLHAIKDYYEMPWLLTNHTGLKATFNLTPPLVEQLLLYAEPLEHDAFLRQWIQPPATLDDDARSAMIKLCKSTQFDTMVKPLPQYAALYHQDDYSNEELLELQTLFILAWCGNYLRQHDETVAALLQKGSGFTQSDKTQLLDALTKFVAGILPYYALLQRKGVISLSTTPYNHPILPLLLDMHNAKRANPHTALPENPLPLEEDAVEQIRRSIVLYEKIFGCKPSGFWPAEGAVDERSVAMYREHGLKWIATDEAILFKSLKNDDRNNLYHPYTFDGVSIGFRDHGLSDLIGFTYRFKKPEEAASHFTRSLDLLGSMHDERTVFVILDGENAWEFYENNAYDFFTALYSRLQESSTCKTVTMDEVSALPQIPLERLEPGSWIHGNFDTWSGHEEKNRAWELIYQTKRDAEHYPGKIDAKTEEAIRFHFLAAECSDWFWWYGDDHATDFAYEFDALFRGHLIAIYRILQMQPPSEMFEPVLAHKHSQALFTYPQSAVAPKIDGKQTSFFEWLGCGTVDEGKGYSTMDRVRGPIEMIRYGHDDTFVYLAFEGNLEILRALEVTLIITVEENGNQLEIPLEKPIENKKIKFAMQSRIELAISKKQVIGLDAFHLRFEFRRKDEIIQTLPGYGALYVDMNEHYSEHWFV